MNSSLMAVILVCMLAAARPCAAAIWTVTSTADDGTPGTLRAALAGAADGDTIDFALATPAVIGLDTNAGPLVVDKSVTIAGPGRDQLTVDGQQGSVVFGVGEGATAAISGLTIANGWSRYNGGGVRNSGTLTLSDCMVRDNATIWGGGGVLTYGPLAVTGCTLSGNSCGFPDDYVGGGAVACVATGHGMVVRIENCLLTGNRAPYGGAVAITAEGDTNSPAHATMTITNCTLSGNTADSLGGALAVFVASYEASDAVTVVVTVADSTLSGNTATNESTDAGGGAIANLAYGGAAMLVLRNTTLINNWSSGLGGAICNYQWVSNAVVALEGCTLSGNGVGSDWAGGGALFNIDGSVTFANCALTGNYSAYLGGAICNVGRVALADSLLSGNIAASGGAICNGFPDLAGLTARVAVARCTLTGNAATGVATDVICGGGAICSVAFSSIASLTIEDSTFSGNTAQAGGAVLNASDAEEEFEPPGNWPPGIADATIMRSTFDGNLAQGTNYAFGGAIANMLASQGTLVLKNSTLVGNAASFPAGDPGLLAVGGAIAAYGGKLTVDNCTLSGNTGAGGTDGYQANGIIASSDMGIKNTILANDPSGFNLAVFDPDHDMLTSYGGNLCTDNGGGFLSDPTDRINTNPLLGPLADNGGPTWTCALLAGSPAIDAASATDIAGDPVTTDQRGTPRPQGAGSDIGAFERVWQNHAPVANAGTNRTVTVPHDGNPATTRASVMLDGSGSFDPDADALTYCWQEYGVTVGTTAAIVIDLEAGVHTLSLTVTDPYGATGSTQVVVTVKAEPNRAPYANAGPRQEVSAPHDGNPAMGTVTVMLDGSKSYDRDGDLITYLWKEGTVTVGTTATLTLTLAVGKHIFMLTVTDPYGAKDTARVEVNVKPEPNRAPTANAGPDQTVVTSGASASVTLNGAGSSDRDGDPLTYTWSEGRTVLSSAVAPSVTLAVGRHTLTLKVTDPYGASATDNVAITIRKP